MCKEVMFQIKQAWSSFWPNGMNKKQKYNIKHTENININCFSLSSVYYCVKVIGVQWIHKLEAKKRFYKPFII